MTIWDQWWPLKVSLTCKSTVICSLCSTETPTQTPEGDALLLKLTKFHSLWEKDALPLCGLRMWQNLWRWGDAVQIPQRPWGVSQMGEAGAAHPHSLGGHTKLLPLQWAFWQGVFWTQISHRRFEIEARSSSYCVCASTLSLLQWCWLCEVLACHPAARYNSCAKGAHSKFQIRETL